MSSTTESEQTDDQPNPFYFRLTLPWYRGPQVILMSVTVAPLRILAFIALSIFAYSLAHFLLLFVDDVELRRAPLAGWKKQLREVIRYTGRIGVYVGGCWNVKIKGQPASFQEITSLVCAPHSSFLDSNLIFLFDECPYIVAKKDTMDYPMFGKLLRTTQPILVVRESGVTNSRRKVVEEMKRRAHSDQSWPSSMVFPEATCSNRKALLPFKPGAFIPGKPVQPVLVKYLDDWDTVTWTWLGESSSLLLAWLSLCKFSIPMEIEYLPVYVPSEEEIANAVLYAENVRRLMARKLGIPCTHLTMDDAKKMNADEKAGLLRLAEMN